MSAIFLGNVTEEAMITPQFINFRKMQQFCRSNNFTGTIGVLI